MAEQLDLEAIKVALRRAQDDGEIIYEHPECVIEDLIAEVERQREAMTRWGLMDFHRCKSGAIRRYSKVLCSLCLVPEDGEDFDPVKEIERLRELVRFDGEGEVRRVRQVAADFEATYRFIVEEEQHRCRDGGEHCECVAFFQLELGKLKAELAELKRRRCKTCVRWDRDMFTCHEAKWCVDVDGETGKVQFYPPEKAGWSCGDWESKEKEKEKSCDA